MASQSKQKYLHGHHSSVLSSHKWRTVENSAAYLMPHIKPHMRILDIGCGPGTITSGFATLVPDGQVVGVETNSEIIAEATRNAQQLGHQNISFAMGDIYNLSYDDASFDVVHVHQVLQHISDPIRALREMRRVAKPGGFVAARETDFGGMLWYPQMKSMDDWRDTYMQVARSTGGDPNAGRKLHVWARQAGFDPALTDKSASTWCYASPEERTWWSNLWAERSLKSNFAETALKNNLLSQQDLERIAQTFQEWGASQDGWFVLVHGEIIYHV